MDEWIPISMVRMGSETWGKALLEKTIKSAEENNRIRTMGLYAIRMTCTPGEVRYEE
jgi:hypothetical protein